MHNYVALDKFESILLLILGVCCWGKGSPFGPVFRPPVFGPVFWVYYLFKTGNQVTNYYHLY